MRHERRDACRATWLDDVIDGPHVKGPGDELVPAVGGHEDDGHVARSQDVLHQLDAVGPRQHEVKQDQIGLLQLCNQLGRRVPILGDADLRASPATSSGSSWHMALNHGAPTVRYPVGTPLAAAILPTFSGRN